jgi:hypothetical protein
VFLLLLLLLLQYQLQVVQQIDVTDLCSVR